MDIVQRDSDVIHGVVNDSTQGNLLEMGFVEILEGTDELGTRNTYA